MPETRPPGRLRGAAARPFQKLWTRIRPAPGTRRVGAFAGLLGAMALGAYLAAQSYSGQPWFVEAGIGAGLVLVATLLVPVATALVRLAWHLLRGTFGAVGLAAFLGLFAVLTMFNNPTMALLQAALAVAIPVMVFGGLAAVTRKGSTTGRIAGAAWTVVGVAALGLGYWWLVEQRGSTDHLVVAAPRAEADLPAELAAGNPSLRGSWTVAELTYGSGTDRHRPEFGSDVDMVTESVNGKPFAGWPNDKGLDGWFGAKGKLREDYWGFGLDALPRNGRVWYPSDGEGPSPLTLIVHGNHNMGDFSDTGYAWLGELLASRGIIAVSVDENFLNSSMIGGSLRRENDLRAWMLLEHLALWRDWNQTPGHRFEGRVDLERIGLVGHSRGGEAVTIASLFNGLSRYPDDATVAFDYGFGIRAVAAIAPVDGQYRPADQRAALRDVDFFTIHGGHDGDVSSFQGDRIFNRVAFTDPESGHFKATAYVYRANHGQFNTTWGDSDSGPPRNYLLNRAALMSGEHQRQVGAVFLSAFLAASLQGQREYVEFFRDPARGRSWLPSEPAPLIVTRFQDASFRALATFDEDVEVTTGTAPGVATIGRGLTVWREGDIELRNGSREDNGVFLGWSDDPRHQPKHASRAAAAPTAIEAVAPAGEARPDAATASSPTAVYELSWPAEQVDATGARDALYLTFDAAVADEKPKAKDYSPGGNGSDDDDDNDNETDGNDESDGSSDEDDSTDEDKDAPPIDWTIEVVDDLGRTARVPLRRFAAVPPPLEVQRTRDGPPGHGSKSSELSLQTVAIPLSALRAAGDIEPAGIVAVRFVFDRAPRGVVVVDRIGFSR